MRLDKEKQSALLELMNSTKYSKGEKRVNRPALTTARQKSHRGSCSRRRRRRREEKAEEKAEGVSAISQKSEDDCDQIGSLQQTPSTEAELWKPGTFMDPAHSSLVSKEFGRLRDEVKKCIRKIGNLSVRGARSYEVAETETC